MTETQNTLKTAADSLGIITKSLIILANHSQPSLVYPLKTTVALSFTYLMKLVAKVLK